MKAKNRYYNLVQLQGRTHLVEKTKILAYQSGHLSGSEFSRSVDFALSNQTKPESRNWSHLVSQSQAELSSQLLIEARPIGDSLLSRSNQIQPRFSARKFKRTELIADRSVTM
ncbi:hypothetical protein O9992_00345 [Vibrio lentus]|nr:hypothetical protein [Vibrio lentus]